MKTLENGTLFYEAAENITVPHMFTTRKGGVSTGLFAAMNIGTQRGDALENVLKNHEILGNALGFDPKKVVRTRQTHSDTVCVADGSLWGAGLYAPALSPCDALISNTPGTTLIISTADCTPVLFYDPVTGAVGAAHAGWRGTAADIVGKTVKKMADVFGCKPENIRAAIGPNIGECCFETDTDVPEAMYALLGEEAAPYISQRGGKYYVNLKGVNAHLLRRAGVTDIDISGSCTACRQDLFWSHRKVGNARGSQGAVIVCKEEEK